MSSSAPIFISYASTDVAAAHTVCAALESAGFGCWIAPRDVLEKILPALVAAVRGHDAAVRPPGVVGAGKPAGATAAARTRISFFRGRSLKIVVGIAVAVGAIALADRLWISKRTAAPVVAATPAPQRVTKSPNSAAAPAISNKSIAVLPFTDMSEKKDQEYFSDSLSEELIDLLAKIPELHVPARTSCFYFKGKSEDIQTIAKRLMVAHVLEGSVRKSGTNLRITAQLIRADTGFHVWSETYDRQLDDVFKVQDEIAGAVVEKLKVALLNAPAAAAATKNAQAYNLYLQARYEGDQDDVADLDKAVGHYEQAIAIDPSYALAYAWLAACYTRRVANGIDTTGVGYAKSRAAAERAIALDPQLADGYLFLAIARVQYELDWADAAQLLRKAQSLDPNNPNVLLFQGHLLQATDTLSAAVDSFRSGIEKDPLNLLLRRYLGRALYYQDKPADAEATLRHLLEFNPHFPGAHYELARVLLARGDAPAALKAAEAESDPAWKSYALPLVYWALHRSADARAALATVVSLSAGAEFQVAETYAYFGV